MRAGLLIALCLLACSSSEHRATRIDPAAPVRVTAGSGTVTVEVADQAGTVKAGLAGRTALGADAGMLFFMGEERNWSFWMKDTPLPLDMVFIGKDLTVNGVIHDAVPMSEEKLYVGGYSLYVLEVNAGWARKHGVQKGTRVTFDNIKL